MVEEVVVVVIDEVVVLVDEVVVVVDEVVVWDDPDEEPEPPGGTAPGLPESSLTLPPEKVDPISPNLMFE